jgi:eukaryotic-like serine/threonine-protein kinase
MPAQSSHKPLVGTILAEKYRITREIGRGGMALVFEAENVAIGKRVAVKVLAAELITSRVVRERFLREARAAAAVRSPYICDVYDVGEFEDRPFLVMELLEGESLYDRMTRERRLDIPATLRVATQTAKGLAKAHAASIVHRDLKPENLFLTRNEEGETITKLLDFGLAKFYAPTGADQAQVRLTREGALFGTPAYMSPEQAKGHGEVDHRTDLWALGCIVYECLTGHTVWSVDQGVAMILAQVASAPIPLPSRLRPDLPPSFDAWLTRALARSVEERFQTAAEFAVSLTEALAPGTASGVQTPSLLVDVDQLIASSLTSQAPSPPASPAAAEEAASAPYAATSISSSPSAVAPPSPSLGPDSARRPPPLAVLPKRRRVPLLVLSALSIVLVVIGVSSYQNTLLELAREHGWWLPASWTRAKPKAAAPSGSGPRRDDLETVAYAGLIDEAQQLLFDGRTDDALGRLDMAIKSGGDAIATNLTSHIKAALETASAPCRLKALGRPRPFHVSSRTARPSLLFGPMGTVVTWVDGHRDKTRRQVFTALLDPALRRLTVPLLALPEVGNASYVQLVRDNQRALLAAFDVDGKRADLAARFVDLEGRLAGSLTEIPSLSRGDGVPALTRDPDGSFWVLGEDDAADGAEDLLLFHLDPGLQPKGPPVRLTALRPDRALKPAAIRSHLAISNGSLRVVFTLRYGTARRVHQMVIPRSDSELGAGVIAPSPPPEHVFLRNAQPLGAEGSNSDFARISCNAEQCSVVWVDDRAGVILTAIEPVTNRPVFHQVVAQRGSAPNVLARPAATLATWQEGGRVRVARIDKIGLGEASNVGKVSGNQPLADLGVGVDVDDWFLGWQDFEAGHFEVVVARVRCQPQR